jgi:hypothetical protein
MVEQKWEYIILFQNLFHGSGNILINAYPGQNPKDRSLSPRNIEYEKKFKKVAEELPSDLDFMVVHALNILGEDGWELVHGEGRQLILKRPRE